MKRIKTFFQRLTVILSLHFIVPRGMQLLLAKFVIPPIEGLPRMRSDVVIYDVLSSAKHMCGNARWLRCVPVA